MDLRIVISTFVLIFLAELGDKTQLAAFAAAGAGSRSFWSVFLGASAALVLSTLIAVLLGSALPRLLPPHYVRLGAGVIFVLVGIMLISSSLRVRATEPTSPPRTTAAELETGTGTLARIAMQAAARFEEAVLEQYERAAAIHPDPGVARVLTALATEERRHLALIHRLACGHPDTFVGEPPAAPEPPTALSRPGRDTQNLLRELAAHEEQAARFFLELARGIPLPTVQRALHAMAAEEREHGRSLRELLKRAD